jgi:hypothetical protein
MGIVPPHYPQLEVLSSDLANSEVQLYAQRRTLTLSLDFVGTRVVCPVCGAACAMKDHAAERSWRHLNAMQLSVSEDSDRPDSPLFVQPLRGKDDFCLPG